MTSDITEISSALYEEFWEVNFTSDLCAHFLSKLKHCNIRILSHATSCSFKIEEPNAITDNDLLCLPEAGLSIDFKQTSNIFLQANLLSEDRLDLVFTSRDRHEQLTIEVPKSEEQSLIFLTKELIKSHDQLPKKATFTKKQRRLCPCCKEKQEKTKSRISCHPLYHIISFACFLNQDVFLEMHGCMASCSRTFLPERECHPQGVISLASTDSIVAIDLAEVFQSIGRIKNIEGEESSIFQCYNSHGNLLLSLIQHNRKLFEAWSQIKEETQGD